MLRRCFIGSVVSLLVMGCALTGNVAPTIIPTVIDPTSTNAITLVSTAEPRSPSTISPSAIAVKPSPLHPTLSSSAPTTIAQSNTDCAPHLPPRLQREVQGRVTAGLANIVRDRPGISNGSQIVGQIPPGGTFTVIDGPKCADGYDWWFVNNNIIEGWTAEGEGTTYWLEPTNVIADCGQGQSPPAQLAMGSSAQVLPVLSDEGSPNALRTEPAMGVDNTILLYVPVGDTVTIINGPLCAWGLRWWQVRYNDKTGWMSDGVQSTFWLEPQQGFSTACPANAALSFAPGDSGQIIDSAALPIRSEPNKGSLVTKLMPHATFIVEAGLQCSGGMRWRQISYNGDAGWIAEGNGNVYWIAPTTHK